MDTVLHTPRLLLRPAQARDVEELAALLAHPEVARWWWGYDARRVEAELVHPEPGVSVWVLQREDAVVGCLQVDEQADPDYRSAGLDVFVGAPWQGRGYAKEALRVVVEHLFGARGHHRLTIDPAADNARALGLYARLGFRRVGVMRQYERGPDGRWHDGVLMELLADEYTRR